MRQFAEQKLDSRVCLLLVAILRLDGAPSVTVEFHCGEERHLVRPLAMSLGEQLPAVMMVSICSHQPELRATQAFVAAVASIPD